MFLLDPNHLEVACRKLSLVVEFRPEREHAIVSGVRKTTGHVQKP